jgi:hypothetical protein
MSIDPAIRRELDERIKHGFSLPDIARWLQEDKTECGDLSRDSLVTTLYRYREDMKPMDVAQRLLPSVIKDAKIEIERQVDELEELQKLYHLQRERIELGSQFEKTTRVLNKYMTQEIAQAAMILMKRHEIKMDLGQENGRALSSASVRPELGANVIERYGNDIAHTASDPLSRGKALSVAKALAALDGDVFDLSMFEDDDS